MSKNTRVTLNKGGSLERTIPINQVVIPDLWHIAEAVRKSKAPWAGRQAANLILKCWSRANDLKRHIEGD